MTVTTRHTVYTFRDLGDGAWMMTSTNPRYAGPLRVRLLDEPRLGLGMLIHRLDGPPKGPIQTSAVTGVDNSIDRA